MIKRYILHIEFHWGYRPRISFKRAPKAGDRLNDGGVPGTLVTCKECGDGLLHQPDSFAGLWPELPRRVSDHTPPPAMDLNADKLEIHHWHQGRCYECEADGSWCDNPHVNVEYPESEPSEIESPETLTLDYTLGTRDYKPGEIVWTHKAEYVVEALENNTLYLVRKDVWEQRNKLCSTCHQPMDSPGCSTYPGNTKGGFHTVAGNGGQPVQAD